MEWIKCSAGVGALGPIGEKGTVECGCTAVLAGGLETCEGSV